jgi:GGDEF domain-containing protein
VGVSLYPDNARDPASLLASADEAMYRVKNAG